MNKMIPLRYFNIGLDLFVIAISAIVFVSLLLDRTKRKGERYFAISILMSIIYCLSDIVSLNIDGHVKFTALNYVLSILAFVICYAITILISGYMLYSINIDKQTRKFVLGLYQVLFCLNTAALFPLEYYGVCFKIENGVYTRMEFWPITILMPLICMFSNCIIILLSREAATRTRLTFTAFSFVPAVAICFSYVIYQISFIPIVFAVIMIILYVNIYIERSKDFYNTQIELQERQMDSMIAQIRPHFLFNCITSCVSLCRIDPERAADMISNFGKYLRGNLDSLHGSKPIPITKELDHIKTYVALEKMRFEDKLDVVYDIQCTSFQIPALTVQPLVENAIKHGISESDKKGTVIISASEREDAFIVEIKDNGRGYDKKASLDSSKTHLGIENVRKRLKIMVGAELSIESKVDVGTVCIITIPKKKLQKVTKITERE